MEATTEKDPVLETVDIPEFRESLQAAGERCKELLHSNDYAGIHATMVDCRRGFILAYSMLLRALEAEQELPELTLDVFVRSAMEAAQKPCTGQDLMKGFAERSFPWMLRTVNAEAKRDEEDQRIQMHEEEARRRLVPLPLGFPPNQNGTHELTRDLPLVLIGPAELLAYILDRITNLSIVSNKFHVIRYGALPTILTARANFMRVGPNHWKGCANKVDSMAENFRKCIAAGLRNPADLIVCDDLSQAVTNSLIGRPPAALAGDALRRFRQFSEKMGCGIVAGLVEESPVDTDDPVYDPLRTFSMFRPVSLETVAGKDGQESRKVIRIGASVFVNYRDEDLAAYRPRIAMA